MNVSFNTRKIEGNTESDYFYFCSPVARKLYKVPLNKLSFFIKLKVFIRKSYIIIIIIIKTCVKFIIKILNIIIVDIN